MKPHAYYNEIDPYAAQWLRNLIANGHIADGIVDERSIEDVTPGDLRGFTQCHFFAGVGVWSYALRLAGWPDDRPVWTGSCPCQPFSGAGKGAGFTDERHLWPALHYLINECRPSVVFGEQVASKDGLGWLDLVQADLEGSGYATGAVDLCAAGVGAPHIRQRLYWVADASHTGFQERKRVAGVSDCADGDSPWQATERRSFFSVGGLDDSRHNYDASEVQAASAGQSQADRPADQPSGSGIPLGLLADAVMQQRPNGEPGLGDLRPGPVNGFWRDADWLLCRDGKWRPVEPGTFPLADGASCRVGRLRAYGNAIIPQVAAEFIGAYKDVKE